MTDKIKVKDLPSFSMLDHLTDLDSIVDYWAILQEEPEGVYKDSGLDICSRAAYRFIHGGSGAVTTPLPATGTPIHFSKWLLRRKFDAIKKTKAGSVGNCYGSLEVFECDLKYYWTIDCPVYGASYQEIPKSLYDELVKFGEGE